MRLCWGVEEVACNLCRSWEHVPLLQRDRYGLRVRTVVCEGCGLVYVSPRPTDEMIETFYAKHYRTFYEGVRAPGADYATRSNDATRAARRLTLFRTYVSSAPALLEIGCGLGLFLRGARDLFPSMRITGVEPDPEFGGAVAGEHGIDVLRSLANAGELHVPARGVVALFHVLEHTVDPRDLLQRIYGLMAPRGIVLLEVPDILGEWRGIDTFHLGHLFHFSEHTLTALLECCGFRTLMVSREGGSECSIAIAAERVDPRHGARSLTFRGPRGQELKGLLTAKIQSGPGRRLKAMSKGAIVSIVGFEQYARLRLWLSGRQLGAVRPEAR